jgi:hypothetical protein
VKVQANKSSCANEVEAIFIIEWKVLTKNFSGLGSVDELILESAAERSAKYEILDFKRGASEVASDAKLT